MVTTLMAFDKNGDGQLTKDELPERMQGLFDRADSDKNGVLTAEEIRKSAQATFAPEGRMPAEARGDGFRGAGHESGRSEGISFMRIDPILAALDTDGNGEISAAELSAAADCFRSGATRRLRAAAVRRRVDRG
jgi:Ca2+-binding EF-hand superfamily protein